MNCRHRHCRTAAVISLLITIVLPVASLLAEGNGEPPAPLRPGERVEIRISDLVGIGVDSVSRPRISEEGMVKVPLLDEEVKIGGLTERQAERAIVEKYRAARVIQNAQVTVRRVAEEDQADPDNAAEPPDEVPQAQAGGKDWPSQLYDHESPTWRICPTYWTFKCWPGYKRV